MYIHVYIYIYTIVNRNIKEPTGRIYGIYPRPQGSYTTAGKLYNHIKVRSRVQQGYHPWYDVMCMRSHRKSKENEG